MNAGNTAVLFFNLPTTIVIWVELVMALLCPWNSDSKTLWGELHGFRIDKACLCKNLNGSEHKFIVVDLSDEHKQPLRLRVESAVHERKDSRAIGSLPMGWLSDTSLPRPSIIRHSTADTVTRINSFPKKTKIIRTIDFNPAERSQRPSLWDLMIISHVVHQDSAYDLLYDLLGRQCFWFADMISAILEKWSETCTGASVKNATRPTRAFFFKRKTNSYTSSGSVKGFPIYQRNPGDVNKIWAQFLIQREEMNKKRQSYEDTKTEGTRKTEELAGQVEELRHQQAQERKSAQKALNNRIVLIPPSASSPASRSMRRNGSTISRASTFTTDISSSSQSLRPKSSTSSVRSTTSSLSARPISSVGTNSTSEDVVSTYSTTASAVTARSQFLSTSSTLSTTLADEKDEMNSKASVRIRRY
ncbi:hypothetical protein M378DRAFT_181284 [Amanita muscaria Koide BX008]|uniref:Uncharacterized protein n=1 Tax=Amanita muscaria (strain Koide BX008) TaxID=946122 RepID=A0A0C2SW81_AMAMK|nr:hypothetical protein M378DRAFT_181284 [Amanita muscaria Koide BX008]